MPNSRWEKRLYCGGLQLYPNKNFNFPLISVPGPPGYGFKDTWYPPPPTSEPPQCICHSNTFITRQQCPKCINSPTGTVHWKSPPLLYPSDPHHHYSDSINNPQFCNSNHGYTPQPYVVSKPPNAPPSMGGYKCKYYTFLLLDFQDIFQILSRHVLENPNV